MYGLNQVSSPVMLQPAYGRKYKTTSEVIEAWRSGKDFKIVGGPYCSIRDVDALGASSIWVDVVTAVIRVE